MTTIRWSGTSVKVIGAFEVEHEYWNAIELDLDDEGRAIAVRQIGEDDGVCEYEVPQWW